jgi:hypothetical protein
MKRTCFVVMALVCAVSMFLGCSQGDKPPNYGGEVKDLPGVSISTAGEVKYYSLSTGLEVTGDDINTNKWDIAFSRTRLILTNSGDTAENLSSGGQGGVWYTDKTVLGEVALGDQITPGGDFEILKDYTTDQKRYTNTGMGGPSAQQYLNAMSYVGYDNENDVDGKDSTEPLTPYSAYNKKTYYKQGHGSSSGPTFENTNQVYIIRHGDGVNHSKIQITYEYGGSPPADTWAVSYQNF